jgi:hypothetical protein
VRAHEAHLVPGYCGRVRPGFDCRVLTGALFADEAFTENADLESEVGRHSDVLVGIVTAGLHGAVVGHRHSDGRIRASKGHECAC